MSSQRVKTNLPATGGAGVTPPPDAPQESAQPISPDALAHMQARAAANERELKPFTPPPAGLILPDPPKPKPDPAVALAADFFGTDQPSAPPVPPVVNPPAEDAFNGALPPLTAEDRARMPAASEGESPSRGILPNLVPPKGDKFEGISRGGFSDVGEAQYFPLSGDELKELVFALMDEIHARIQNDLRFSLAVTYPRVRAVVEIRIEGHAEDGDAGFQIQKILVPKDGRAGSTPEEIASTKADAICFVVRSLRQEVTPEGDHESPPDAIRAELGLSAPRKQLVEGPGGMQSFVDVVSPGSDLRALTR